MTMGGWDVESGAAFGKPLGGHTGVVGHVAYSPDGRHIISGSYDKTIRIWNVETGVAVGKPLQGHKGQVFSVAYSPDGRHIISGSRDKTIRIWDAETGAAVGKPLEGHTDWVRSVAYSPDGQHIISGSDDKTIRIWSAETSAAAGRPLEGATTPNSLGWVKDTDGGLLYWVPLDCHRGLHSPALITIPLMSDSRSVSLDFEEFAFGTAWTEIFKCTDLAVLSS